MSLTEDDNDEDEEARKWRRRRNEEADRLAKEGAQKEQIERQTNFEEARVMIKKQEDILCIEMITIACPEKNR